MEVNSHQSVENLQTSAIAPSPGAGGASDAAPNGGGGGLEVLGQAVESTTTAPSKESPAEAAPAPAPTTGNGSSAGTSRNQNDNHHFDLTESPASAPGTQPAREPLLEDCPTADVVL